MLRSHRARLFVLLLVTPLLATSGGAAAAVPIARPVSDMPAIQLELVTRHLSEPVDVTHAGDGQIVEFVESIYRGDRYRLVTSLSIPQGRRRVRAAQADGRRLPAARG